MRMQFESELCVMLQDVMRNRSTCHESVKHTMEKKIGVIGYSNQKIQAYFTHCPYIKTHEPYIYEPSAKPRSYILSVNRAALILKHPFDSAFSEFKRYVFVM